MKSRKRGRKKNRVQACFFLLPSFVGIILFYIGPYGRIIQESLVNNSIQMEFAGLDNFYKVIENQAFQLAVRNTVLFSGISVPLTILCALGLAFLINDKMKGFRFIRSSILSPIVVPAASVVLVWRLLFERFGEVNKFLELFGGTAVDWFGSSWAMVPMVVMFLWKNVGYDMVLFLGGIHTASREQIEVAQLEGASKWYIFRSVYLRALSPTLFFSTLITLMNSFKIFREVYLLTGDYPSNGVYLISHFMNNMLRNMDYQRLCVAAILVTLVIAFVLVILFALESRFGKDVEG